MSQSKRPNAAVPPRGGKGSKGGSRNGQTTVPPRGGAKGRSSSPPPRATRPTTGRPAPKPSASSGQSTTAREQSWQRRRRQRQQRNGLIGVIILVVALVGGFIIYKAVKGSGPSHGTALPAAIQSQVTGVSVADLVSAAQTAQTGTSAGQTNPPSVIQGPASLGGAKPTIFYAGAEYCPFCAAERWPLVMALSHFGTFTGLEQTTSSSTDTNANTPTFSFRNATFTSDYLTLQTVEMENRLDQKLQTPTKAQQALIDKYDYPPYVSGQGGSIPFILFGSQYLVSGGEYDASAIAGDSMQDAASILTATSTEASDASTNGKVSLAAKATAGHLMGAICSITDNKPPVCSQVPASLKPSGTSSGGQTSSGS